MLRITITIGSAISYHVETLKFIYFFYNSETNTRFPPFYTRQKKKRNSKIFPLSFPFNAKMLIVIKDLVLIKSSQKSSVA